MTSTLRQRRIRIKYGQLIEKLNTTNDLIQQLQEQCLHPTITKQFGSNSGNYLNKDIYWVDCFCSDCHKFWREYDDNT